MSFFAGSLSNTCALSMPAQKAQPSKKMLKNKL